MRPRIILSTAVASFIAIFVGIPVSMSAPTDLAQQASSHQKQAAKTPDRLMPWFKDLTADLGIDFTHRHHGTGEKYMIENMGSGVVIFDADGDSRLDIYFVQGSPIQTGTQEKPADTSLPDYSTNKLYRQLPNGTFTDISKEAGVDDDGYGMGASFGDYDRDGDLDLYVTNFGPNVLYRNRGDGSFEDVTALAGVECDLWSASSGFFDGDGDGDLDLYVTNYLDFDFDHHQWCGNAQTATRAYCHPAVYEAPPDCYYRNEGNGSFTEVGRESGIIPTPDGKGLGVAFADLNGDGHQDIYVANDATMNYFYVGSEGGLFTESALFSGVGFNGAGAAESSMGVQIGDLDGDSLPEIFLTHLDQQTNTLYRNKGESDFSDHTDAAGLGTPSLPWVGFGTLFIDYDNDGDLDIFVTNGHIIDNIELFDPSRAHRQPTQLFENDGTSRFTEVSERLDLEEVLVGRGAAMGDLDRDGDLDIVFTQNDGPAFVLINRGESPSRSLGVRLIGVKSNPQGFGAEIEVRSSMGVQVRPVLSSSSYLSQSPPEVYFGLGESPSPAEVVVRWPSGHIDRHAGLEVGFLHTITEGSSKVASSRFK
jgi:hypothetical protein